MAVMACRGRRWRYGRLVEAIPSSHFSDAQPTPLTRSRHRGWRVGRSWTRERERAVETQSAKTAAEIECETQHKEMEEERRRGEVEER